VRVTGQRFSLNMISAISPRKALRFMVAKGGVGARVFIEFLKRLMHGHRRSVSHWSLRRGGTVHSVS